VLNLAREWQTLLPFENLDLLIIDFIGKNISGTGMDANVVGRRMQTGEPELTTPEIKRIYVRDLTDESGGNATGIGLADFTSTRLVEKFDRPSTYANLITGGGPQKGRLPMYLDSDREVLAAALNTIGVVPPDQARIVRIFNTLHLEKLEVSEPLAQESEVRDELSVLALPSAMAFDAQGNFTPWGN